MFLWKERLPMDKKIYLPFLIIYSVIASITLSSCGMNQTNSITGTTTTTINDLSTDKVIDNGTHSKEREYSNAKPTTYNNLSYELFYGEWEASDRIYIDPVPINGVHYSDSEVKETADTILKNIKTQKIQFTSNCIVINGNEIRENIDYKFRIFPSDDNYKIHFTMTLKDIGLTEAEGNYYVFVETKTEDDSVFEGSSFFIKDENTLVVYRGYYCIEYTRVSFDGGSSKPVIIPG
jgi:hypothetical protein